MGIVSLGGSCPTLPLPGRSCSLCSCSCECHDALMALDMGLGMRDQTSCRQGNGHFSYCCWKYQALTMSDFFHRRYVQRGWIAPPSPWSPLFFPLFTFFCPILTFSATAHSSSQFSNPIQCLSECPASASTSHGTVPLPPNVISLFDNMNLPQSGDRSPVPGKTIGQHLPVLGHMGL